MALLGGLQHGVYLDEEDDPCEGMSVNEIRRHFGLEPEEGSDIGTEMEEEDITDGEIDEDDEYSIVANTDEVEETASKFSEDEDDDDEETATSLQEEANFPETVRI